MPFVALALLWSKCGHLFSFIFPVWMRLIRWVIHISKPKVFFIHPHF
jgi:hypothetical protein